MSITTTTDIRRVAGSLGAEVTGLRLGPDMPDHEVASLRAAILEHKLVVVRGQDHLDDRGHAGFVRRLGALTTAHPTITGGQPEAAVLPVDSEHGNKANSWHTDVTFVDRPPAFTTLRAVVLPPFGGDTLFANTARAYANLPAGLRTLADGLWAEHSNDYDYATTHAVEGPTGATADYHQQFTATVYRTHHPVVRVHPETGERVLQLGQFVSRILGVNGQDSRDLLALYQRHITRQENIVRWRWAPGDFAVWDNRATQHYAVADYGDLPRRMHRVTVAGDVPVSITGERSRSVEGDAAAYAGAGS